MLRVKRVVEVEDQMPASRERHSELPDVVGLPPCPASTVHVDETREGRFSDRYVELTRQLDSLALTEHDALVELGQLGKFDVVNGEVARGVVAKPNHVLKRPDRRVADVDVRDALQPRLDV